MAKDPAFLFYSSDFLTGTSLLSDEQVGKYIRLLCIQHQSGRLKEKDMLKICKTYDDDIFEKFEKDENGMYYNSRLEDEINKRKAYSESRRNNRRKKDMINISETYVEHMENENENESIIKNEIVHTEEFLKFNQWLKNNAPNVLKLKEPITEDQFQKLKQYDKNMVAETLIAMHNKKDLTKKYVSAYLTLINWIKRNNTNDNGKSRIESSIDVAKQYIEQSRANGI